MKRLFAIIALVAGWQAASLAAPLVANSDAKPDRNACIKRLMAKKATASFAPLLCASITTVGAIDCLLKKKSIVNATAEAQACEIRDPALYACVDSYLHRPGLRNADDARKICEASEAEAGRECVYRNFVGQKKFRFMRDALEICRFRSEETRSCLLAYANEEAPFDFSAEERDRLVPILKSAAPLCAIDDHDDRACVLKLLRKGKEERVDRAYLRCRELSREQQNCQEVVTKRIGPALAAEICAVPNFEIRSCMLEKYASKTGQPFYPGFRTICETEFLKNLLNPLEGSAHGAGCDFLR